MQVDVLAIGAHPDDAEIGCAGFLLKAKARGLKTGILVLTQGEMGTFGGREVRVAEARAAAEILKVDTFRILDLPDARLEFNYENALRITEILKELRPRMVLSPYADDTHPDHQVTAKLVERAAYLATRTGILPDAEPLIPQPRHLTFSLCFKRTLRPDVVLDITDVYGTKQKALQAHGSQYGPILFAVEIAARYYGMMIPAAYGEGFLFHDPILLTDELGII
ncbi:MAG: PIG-L family deacetylase [Anaerolineae bacterium]|jgi:bacillithiol biosynthesis deacetylase BshB1